MKTIAILGAAGFTGRALCEKLSAQKVKLLLLSRRAGRFKNLPIKAVDLSQPGSLAASLKNKKVDVLFYLSSAMPNDFDKNAASAGRVNDAMHKNVYQCWKEQRFHLIYASSAAVYGQAPHPWEETVKVLPETSYAMSKRKGEEIFLKEFERTDLPLTILRIKAPYGLKTRGKTVVNSFIERALMNQDLELWGTGKRQQDFIYIKDLAQVFWLAYTKKRFGIYNVASGKVTTMKQLAQAVIKATKSKSNIIFNGKADPTEKIPAKMDLKKLRRDLGFRPKFTLAAGLKDMLHALKKERLSK